MAGWNALKFRHRNCRAGYRIYPEAGSGFRMQLVGGDVIGESEIAGSVLAPYRGTQAVRVRSAPATVADLSGQSDT